MIAFFLQGLAIGIVSLIPGVSGMTVAVALGIYRRLIDSTKNFTKHWQSSLDFLLPFWTGVAIGIGLAVRLVAYGLTTFPFPTAMLFIGLLAGSIPLLLKQYWLATAGRKQLDRPLQLLILVISFCVALILALIQLNSPLSGLSMTFPTLWALFSLGVLSSVAFLIPGFSGSLLIMLLGFYALLTTRLMGFMHDVLTNSLYIDWNSFFFVITFISGFIIGFIIFSHFVMAVVINYGQLTFASAFGVLLAAPLAIIVCTKALANLQGSISVVLVMSALLFLVVGFMTTYVLGLYSTEFTREHPHQGS